MSDCQHCNKPRISMPVDEFERIKREEREKAVSYAMLMFINACDNAFAGTDYENRFTDIGVRSEAAQARANRYLKTLYESGIVYRESKKVLEERDARRAARKKEP